MMRERVLFVVTNTHWSNRSLKDESHQAIALYAMYLDYRGQSSSLLASKQLLAIAVRAILTAAKNLGLH